MLKSVTVLQKILNATLKRTVIPGIFCGLWIMQILLLYGTIKLLPGFGNNLSLLVFYLGLYLNVSVGSIIATTFASRVFTTSYNLIDSWKKRQHSYNKVRQKQLASLAPTHIKCGDNFIDKSTAIVAQNFIANQTVSLILLQ